MIRRWKSNRSFGRTRWIAGAAIALAFALPTAVSRFRNDVIRPGALTSPHAQILSTRSNTDACSACHPASQRDDAVLTLAATQTALCLECHRDLGNETVARWAHQMSPDEREQLVADIPLATATPTHWINPNDVACSVCHREHHGADHDLMAMADAQCQSCHHQQFGSFASGHPPWSESWGKTSAAIAFDHRRHESIHFPASATVIGQPGSAPSSFDCQTCHQIGSDGRNMATVDYAVGCGNCHDAALQRATAPGFELVSLPIVSTAVAAQIGQWPAAAIGFGEMEPSPLPEWMIDRSGADAKQIATQRLDWMRRYADRGQAPAIDDFVTQGWDRSDAIDVFSNLSPQLIAAGLDRWIRPATVATIQQVAFASDDLLALPTQNSTDLLPAADPLLLPLDGSPDDALEWPQAKSIVPAATPRFRASEMLVGAGWYRDDTTYSIRYAAGSHADPVLTALIAAAVKIGGPKSDAVLEMPSVAACLRCHSGAATSQRSWTTAAVSSRRSLTQFSHAPHLQISRLADCRTCHANQTGIETTHDFTVMQVQDCATCHHDGGASDSCTTCHRYHTQ